MATRPDYALASRERLDEARILMESSAYAGAIYLSGRAAESILKAHIEADSKQIKGHNLGTLAREANIARRLTSELQLKVNAAIAEASAVWSNDYRYRSADNLD